MSIRYFSFLLLTLISINFSMAENMIVDDLKNQSGIPDEEFCEGGNAKWCFVTDKVMGGISKGSLDFKKENEIILAKIKECLKNGDPDSLQIDDQLLDQIEKYANIKHIIHKNDKDESKIVEIFNDIKNELKTHDLELRIQELESKFAEDFNQNTFDEINRLKKEQNIN